MKPEKRHLIDDLLDEEGDARREATLLASARILRRRRWRRVMVQSLAVVAILGIAALMLPRPTPPRPVVLTSIAAPPGQVRSLTDAELLDLFPNTPVGLAKLTNGKKRLIFPRPGDEARFLTRL
jgi:hypothetical protein